MTDPHLSAVLLEIGSGLTGLLTSALLTVRYYLHCRLKEFEAQSRIKLKKTGIRAQAFRDLVDEFRKEVSRLNVITQSHASKLTETIATCAELKGELHVTSNDLAELKRQNIALVAGLSKLYGVVSSIQADFEMAKKKLHEKPITGSGGLTKLEEEKKKS